MIDRPATTGLGSWAFSGPLIFGQKPCGTKVGVPNKESMSEMVVSQKICAHRPGIFGDATTGRGTIFIFAADFYPIEGGARQGPAKRCNPSGSCSYQGDHFHFSQQIPILSKEELAGPAEEQMFCPAKLPMPRVGAADLMVSPSAFDPLPKPSARYAGPPQASPQIEL